MRRRIDLLVLHSSETVTVNETLQNDLGIIDEGGVAVDQGRILDVASSQLLERKYSAAKQLSADGGIILPGFVDPHSHLVFQGSREEEFRLRQQGASYIEILKKGGGIMETVNKTRVTSRGELVCIAQQRLDTALESGTTTMEIKSGYGLQPYDEFKILYAIQQLKRSYPCRIVPTFLGAHAIPPSLSPEDYSRTVVRDMIPVVSQQGLAEFCDVFCEDGVFNPEFSKTILKAGIARGLRPKIHADQFTNGGGAKIANEVEAVSADHLIRSSMNELERMKKTKVIPVVLPASSHSLLTHHFAPAREMLAKNLPVALGSDFSPSNWILGLLLVGAIAARELRMRSEEIIRGITINAARALGLHKHIGSLHAGKAADLVILKIPSHRRIGYDYGEGVVDNVLIAGTEVVKQGKRII